MTTTEGDENDRAQEVRQARANLAIKVLETIQQEHTDAEIGGYRYSPAESLEGVEALVARAEQTVSEIDNTVARTGRSRDDRQQLYLEAFKASGVISARRAVLQLLQYQWSGDIADYVERAPTFEDFRHVVGQVTVKPSTYVSRETDPEVFREFRENLLKEIDQELIDLRADWDSASNEEVKSAVASKQAATAAIRLGLVEAFEDGKKEVLQQIYDGKMEAVVESQRRYAEVGFSAKWPFFRFFASVARTVSAELRTQMQRDDERPIIDRALVARDLDIAERRLAEAQLVSARTKEIQSSALTTVVSQYGQFPHSDVLNPSMTVGQVFANPQGEVSFDDVIRAAVEGMEIENAQSAEAKSTERGSGLAPR